MQKKVTDSMWDAAYNAALKSDDMAEAQKLRDMHFMVKSNSAVAENGLPNSLKLANAITYDDVGNIIPLSQRDNFNIRDFRYALTPILFGSGIGSYYLNNK